MNFWNHPPNRDEVLDKIYDFMQLLSQNKPDEAAKLVNVRSFQKFRDTLHYQLTDYLLLTIEDKELHALPDDLSVNIVDPYSLDETLVNPQFTGNDMVTAPNERVTVQLAVQDELTPVKLEFLLYSSEGNIYLNLMKVSRD